VLRLNQAVEQIFRSLRETDSKPLVCSFRRGVYIKPLRAILERRRFLQLEGCLLATPIEFNLPPGWPYLQPWLHS